MSNQTESTPVKSEYHQRLQDLAASGCVYESLSKKGRTELLAFYMRQMPTNEAPDLLGCMTDIQAKAYASAMSRIIEKPNIIDQEAVNALLTNVWLDTYDSVFRSDLEDAIWQHAEDDRERRQNQASQAEFKN